MGNYSVLIKNSAKNDLKKIKVLCQRRLVRR